MRMRRCCGIRLRAPAGTRIEETERIVLRALDVIGRESGHETTSRSPAISSGVVPSSYPVDLIHLFTSGPQEAIIQVALKPDTPRGEALREKLRASLTQLPETRVSFEAGDIVTQVMSFGSPTPMEIAVQGIESGATITRYAQKIRSELAKLSFLRDLQFAQEDNFPTLDINIDRETGRANSV